jgi:hypothetical protein
MSRNKSYIVSISCLILSLLTVLASANTVHAAACSNASFDGIYHLSSNLNDSGCWLTISDGSELISDGFNITARGIVNNGTLVVGNSTSWTSHKTPSLLAVENLYNFGRVFYQRDSLNISYFSNHGYFNHTLYHTNDNQMSSLNGMSGPYSVAGSGGGAGTCNGINGGAGGYTYGDSGGRGAIWNGWNGGSGHNGEDSSFSLLNYTYNQSLLTAAGGGASGETYGGGGVEGLVIQAESVELYAGSSIMNSGLPGGNSGSGAGGGGGGGVIQLIVHKSLVNHTTSWYDVLGGAGGMDTPWNGCGYNVDGGSGGSGKAFVWQEKPRNFSFEADYNFSVAGKLCYGRLTPSLATAQNLSFGAVANTYTNSYYNGSKVLSLPVYTGASVSLSIWNFSGFSLDSYTRFNRTYNFSDFLSLTRNDTLQLEFGPTNYTLQHAYVNVSLNASFPAGSFYMSLANSSGNVVFNESNGANMAQAYLDLATGSYTLNVSTANSSSVRTYKFYVPFDCFSGEQLSLFPGKPFFLSRIGSNTSNHTALGFKDPIVNNTGTNRSQSNGAPSNAAVMGELSLINRSITGLQSRLSGLSNAQSNAMPDLYALTESMAHLVTLVNNMSVSFAAVESAVARNAVPKGSTHASVTPYAEHASFFIDGNASDYRFLNSSETQNSTYYSLDVSRPTTLAVIFVSGNRTFVANVSFLSLPAATNESSGSVFSFIVTGLEAVPLFLRSFLP